jgi:RNA polymerase sigma-70 factor (ECF subfamily)
MSTPRTLGARTTRRASTHSDSYDFHTLADWMERYVAGDRRAFVMLYRAIEPRVRRQIRARLGNHAGVDDLVQYTMLRAHSARARYCRPAVDADEALVAWYCAIARNVANNFLRSCGRDRLQLGDEPETLAAVPHDCEDVEQRSVAEELAQERCAALHAAIAALPPGQRVVVRMHRLEELPMAEVSRRLGVRNGAVRVRAHRAYENLRALMLGTTSRGLAA